ncbi:hypothetical protein DPMN_174908 [Dreissena polymorpha]|uniref:Uncharacterized protein n=1 Tax=Dreissena polymorpha TaxID=45954 RepID=A0A9D4E765_DREPO|nr:hypothetical protein DPMN_174908 [Dreissena polymorpha]
MYASFRKTSIYPYDPNAIDSAIFKPSEALQQGTSPLNIQPSEKEVYQFFCNKTQTSMKQPTKKRTYLSSVVSGKAITEDVMVQRIHEHEDYRNTKTKSQKLNNTEQPGPFGIIKILSPVHAIDESSDDAADIDVCCVCNQFTPSAVRLSTSLMYVRWVQCSQCVHWVHLLYCSQVRVVRRVKRSCVLTVYGRSEIIYNIYLC